MLRLIKWIYELGVNHGTERARAEIYGLRTYHIQKAEIAMLKAKHEPDDPKYDDDFARFMQPKLTPQEHSAIANELGRMISNWHSQDEVKHDGR